MHLHAKGTYEKPLFTDDPDPDDWGLFNSVYTGLRKTVWPGRFEILSEKPLIVLDGAHNAAGMKMLVETWRAFLATRFGWSASETEGRAHIVFGSVADKDITEMAQLLRPLAGEGISLVRLANEREAPSPRNSRNRSPDFSAPVTIPCLPRGMILPRAIPPQVILITGSLFLVGEMLALRQGNAEEYRLNERLEKHA